MKNQLNIPTKIRVGTQYREGTYTNKLGYVIYYDSKGKLRKERSFESWRHKVGKSHRVFIDGEWTDMILGEDFAPQDFDNVPTEGFVMNKKAGGTSWGWHTRQTKCRVYDPRGFEFEISIENLLFILQETNSIKGKGLEGEFVYSWDGKDLVLLPVTSQEYKESMEFTSLKTMKVTKADMVEGATYLTKDEKEVVYLGRYPWYELVRRGRRNYSEKVIDGQKEHIFVYVDKIDKSGDRKEKYMLTRGFTGLAKKTSDEVSNFAEIFDSFAKSRFATKPTGLEMKPKGIDFPEVDLKRYNTYQEAPSGTFFLKSGENKYTKYVITVVKESRKNWRVNNEDPYIFKGYQLLRRSHITFDENEGIKIVDDSERGYSSHSWSWDRNRGNNTTFYTQQELIDKGLQELIVDLESGNKVELNKY